MHSPEWHILDNDFAPADAGLQTPVRVLAHGNCRLAIANLDRSDPPATRPAVFRAATSTPTFFG